MTRMFLLPARCAGLSQNVPTHEVGLEFHLLRNSSSELLPLFSIVAPHSLCEMGVGGYVYGCSQTLQLFSHHMGLPVGGKEQ